MTNKDSKNKMPTREEWHRTYAGEITEDDFNGYASLVAVADKIEDAEKFNTKLETLKKILELVKQYERDKN